MNLSEVIRVKDLQPAIAVGNYLEANVTEVFHSFSYSKGRQKDAKVLSYLQNVGGPVDYRSVYRAIGMSANELSLCVEPLIKPGLIKSTYRQGTGGKSIRMLEVV